MALLTMSIDNGIRTSFQNNNVPMQNGKFNETQIDNLNNADKLQGDSKYHGFKDQGIKEGYSGALVTQEK
eukprot:CAMPEP_0168351584 /NCGR_PEP_ID=MMETSP0213-20121227/21963_1 /TAXON_ID=151035 /ORGANISM="Euplotes harpa, Strain FSP1.4" /LENGTH=69 /DNA_ID=CAMNT_0008362473 /DNA_START=74 /DNA_END=283 /DNA_ORIENTATION=+